MGSSRTRDETGVSCTDRQVLYHWATRKALHCLLIVQLVSLMCLDVKSSDKTSLPSMERIWILLMVNSAQFSSFRQSCPTLCNPMDCSTPDFLVHHQLLELAQTRVLPIGDVMPQSFSSSRVEVSGLLNSSVALNNFCLFYSFFLFSCSLTFPFLQSSRVLHFFQSIC